MYVYTVLYQIFSDRFMNGLSLPWTYGSSGIKMKYGLGNCGVAGFHTTSRFIVNAIRGKLGKVVNERPSMTYFLL